MLIWSAYGKALRPHASRYVAPPVAYLMKLPSLLKPSDVGENPICIYKQELRRASERGLRLKAGT